MDSRYKFPMLCSSLHTTTIIQLRPGVKGVLKYTPGLRELDDSSGLCVNGATKGFLITRPSNIFFTLPYGLLLSDTFLLADASLRSL